MGCEVTMKQNNTTIHTRRQDILTQIEEMKAAALDESGELYLTKTKDNVNTIWTFSHSTIP